MQENSSLIRRSTDSDQNGLRVSDLDLGYTDSAYYEAETEPSDRRQFYSILAVLRKYLLLIIGVTLFTTAAALVYEAQQPDYYTATVRIQVNNEMNPAAGAVSVMNSGNDPAYFATQLQILEGPGLLRRVASRLDLKNDPSFLRPKALARNSVWQNVLRMFGLGTRSASTQESNTDPARNDKGLLDTKGYEEPEGSAEELAPFVGAIRRDLDVDPVRDNRTSTKETRLIEVRYTHYDPNVAARVVNTIAETYVIQNLEQKVQTNASVGDFLQKRVGELQSQIRIGEENLINYSKNNQILSLDSTQNTVVQRLSDLNGKLSQAESDRIAAEAALMSAKQNPTGDLSGGQDGRTSGLESQLTTLKQQLEQLKVEYTDEWPAVKQVKRQIESIENELKNSRQRSTTTTLAGLEQKFREASTRERELRSSFDSQRKAVLSQNEAAINYRIIQQEIDTNKSLLDGLLQRSRENGVILSGTPNNVSLVDKALAPSSPDGPRRSRGILLAFLASLFGSIVIAFALNWLDDTVSVYDDFEMITGVPVIGLIPGSPAGIGAKLLGTRYRNHRRSRLGKFDYSSENFDVPVVVEAYHQLRTSVLLSTPGGAPKSLLVTSGQSFEGKTVTSLNLARSLSELGDRVLLIDADLRSPKLHLINGLHNKSGLSTLLTSRGIDQSVIESTIHRDVVDNLDILTSGPKVPNPANFFASQEMQQLLAQLESIYSYIVIDSPPALYFADSVVLATYVDAVVLVARANFSSREYLMGAKKRIQEVRGNTIGIIVNDVPIGNYKYYNAGYYRHLEEGDELNPAEGLLKLD